MKYAKIEHVFLPKDKNTHFTLENKIFGLCSIFILAPKAGNINIKKHPHTVLKLCGDSVIKKGGSLAPAYVFIISFLPSSGGYNRRLSAP